jgi:transposase
MVQEGIAAQNGQRFGVVARVARQLGIGTESLRQWVNQAEVDAGQRPGTSTADGQRIAELEREVRELRRANDILKAGGCRTKFCSSSAQPTASGPVARRSSVSG